MGLASKKEKDLDQHRWGEQHDEGTATKTQGPGTRNGSGNRQVPAQSSRLAARHQLPGWAWAHRAAEGGLEPHSSHLGSSGQQPCGRGQVSSLSLHCLLNGVRISTTQQSYGAVT